MLHATYNTIQFAPALFAFALASLIIEMTPGPNMAYLIALTLAQGVRAGFTAVR